MTSDFIKEKMSIFSCRVTEKGFSNVTSSCSTTINGKTTNYTKEFKFKERYKLHYLHEYNKESQKLSKIIGDIFYNIFNDDKLRKHEGGSKNNNKEFSYWMNIDFYSLYKIIQILGIKQICDLGCGVGAGLKGIKKLDDSIIIRGYDNVKDLIVASKEKEFYYKDITKLCKGDLCENELVYMYEPFVCKKLSKVFVSNLGNVMLSGQIIALVSYPSTTIDNIFKDNRFVYICDMGNLVIFIKK